MSGLKQHLPLVSLIFSSVSFMNAKSASAAGLFGMLTPLAAAWLIARNRKSHQ